ncbi:hypothetical protein D3C71_1234980 [compost metagenome]
MWRNILPDIIRSLFVADARFMAQSDVADIFIEMVGVGIAIPVGFVSAYRVFVPFTGKHALSADRLKAVTNATDTGKQVNKAKSVVRMGSRRAWKQVLQEGKFPFAKAVPCPLAGDQSLEDRRAPVAFPLGIQFVHQRFCIIDGQQFAE